MSDKEVVGRGNKDINQECKEKKRIMKLEILTLNRIKITVAKHDIRTYAIFLIWNLFELCSLK